MQCKLQVETPSDHTYSFFWAELSGLLGEKIPVAIVGPLGLQSSALTTWPPSNPLTITSTLFLAYITEAG